MGRFDNCPGIVTLRLAGKSLQEASNDAVGKVLTQIDMAMPMSKQSKELKVAVKKTIYRTFDNLAIKFGEEVRKNGQNN